MASGVGRPGVAAFRRRPWGQTIAVDEAHLALRIGDPDARRAEAPEDGERVTTQIAGCSITAPVS